MPGDSSPRVVPECIVSILYVVRAAARGDLHTAFIDVLQQNAPDAFAGYQLWMYVVLVLKLTQLLTEAMVYIFFLEAIQNGTVRRWGVGRQLKTLQYTTHRDLYTGVIFPHTQY